MRPGQWTVFLLHEGEVKADWRFLVIPLMQEGVPEEETYRLHRGMPMPAMLAPLNAEHKGLYERETGLNTEALRVHFDEGADKKK